MEATPLHPEASSTVSCCIGRGTACMCRMQHNKRPACAAATTLEARLLLLSGLLYLEG